MIVTAERVLLAVGLVWLGMVLAISFLEAPLKFRTPGLELALGLAIGRIVFRALNATEAVWAVVVVVCLIGHAPPAAALIGSIVAVVVLVAQLAAVRPALNRRSDRVLAHDTPTDAPRSHAHFAYVGLELLKVAGLIALAVGVLAQ